MDAALTSKPWPLDSPLLILSAATIWVTRGASAAGAPLWPRPPRALPTSSHRDTVNPKSHPVPPLLKPFHSSPLIQHRGHTARLSVKGPQDLLLSSLPSTLLSVIHQPHRLLNTFSTFLPQGLWRGCSLCLKYCIFFIPHGSFSCLLRVSALIPSSHKSQSYLPSYLKKQASTSSYLTRSSLCLFL